MTTQRVKRTLSASIERIGRRRSSHSISIISRNVSHSVEMTEIKYESDKEMEANGDDKHIADTTFDNKTPYMIAYLLVYILLGSDDSADSAIYLNIQHQLNITPYTMAWIYAAGDFATIPGTLISGYLIDKYIETHRYAAIMLFIGIITDCLVPFTTNITVMIILFILDGLVDIDTCSAVWIFRLYPENGGKMYFFFDTVRDVSGTLTPLIFEWSISATGEYSYPIFAFAVISFIAMVFFLFLPTPTHDKLRTIKRDIAKATGTNSTNGAVSEDEALKETNQQKLDAKAAKMKASLKKHPKYKKTQWAIIIIFAIMMFMYAAFSEGTGVYIVLYCEEHLGVNGGRVGRILLTVFMAANVLYRFIDLFLTAICKIELDVLCFIYFANIIQMILVVLWIFFDDSLILLFVIFGICGFLGSPTYPGMCELIEDLRPITGFLSCMFGICYLGGDAISALVIGVLIDKYGAVIYPIALSVPLGVMVIFTTINVGLYAKYERIKSNTIDYQSVSTV